MARCADRSSAPFPLDCDTFTEPGTREPLRNKVNVTATCGAEVMRASISLVRQFRATWSRSALAYHPNLEPSGESLPRPTPPPPGMLYIGELTACPLL